jgi:hypothetical protein
MSILPNLSSGITELPSVDKLVHLVSCPAAAPPGTEVAPAAGCWFHCFRVEDCYAMVALVISSVAIAISLLIRLMVISPC